MQSGAAKKIVDVHAHFVVWRPDSAKRDAIDVFRRGLRGEVESGEGVRGKS